MTLEEYLEAMSFQNDIMNSNEKKNRIKDSFYQLEKIGFLERKDHHDIVVEEMRDGSKRKITNPLEVSLAMREIGQRSSYYQNANRFLYAILNTQGRFDEFQELLPHTVDMLYSLCHLRFQFFPFFELPKGNKDVRELASYVLPYEIAMRHVSSKDFYTRLRARIEGYAILNHYYSAGKLLSQEKHFSPKKAEDYLIPLLVGGDLEKPMMESIIEQVYQNAEDIIHCDDDQFISAIYPLSLSYVMDENEKNHYMIFPEVSMIYACAMMGEEDIVPLFDLDLSFLKKYTLKVYHDYHQLMKNK